LVILKKNTFASRGNWKKVPVTQTIKKIHNPKILIKMETTYMIKYENKIFYLKSTKIVRAILIDNPQQVLKRTITFNK